MEQGSQAMLHEIQLEFNDKYHEKDSKGDSTKFNLLQPKIDLSEPNPYDSIMKWAERNIGENGNTKLQLIDELRDMIFERGECEPQRIDDAFLMRFLRARHFIVRMAHRLFVNYHTFREENPNYFSNVNFDRILALGETDIFSVPPYVDQDNRRLLFFRIGDWDTSEFTTEELFQVVIFLIQAAILEPQHQILGGICIIDVASLGAGHAWYMTPTIAKHMLAVAYNSLPHRVEAVHVINVSKIFDYAFGMIKPLLSDHVKQKIIIHPDMESLHKYVSPKYLPKRYGGIHKDYKFKDWISVLKENKHLIDEIETSGYEGGREFLENLK